MKIYNDSKTEELEYETLDFEKGYIIGDKLITHIPANPGRKEEGHYKTVREYPNGGKDVEWVIDVEGIPSVEEHDEEEDIGVYKLYTEEELAENRKNIRIEEIKIRLSNLSDDFIQVQLGAKFDDYEERKLEFQTLHNELRGLLGKEERIYE